MHPKMTMFLFLYYTQCTRILNGSLARIDLKWTSGVWLEIWTTNFYVFLHKWVAHKPQENYTIITFFFHNLLRWQVILLDKHFKIINTKSSISPLYSTNCNIICDRFFFFNFKHYLFLIEKSRVIGCIFFVFDNSIITTE